MSAAISRFRAAYRRALTATDVPQDLCKINIALAQCYLEDYDSKVGYKGVSSQQDDEDNKLERAEQYYQDALKYASERIKKMSILKKIGKIQFRRNHIDEWTETQIKLAMKFYQGEDRSNVLVMIARRNPRLRQEYLEQAFIETKRSRKIRSDKKKVLLLKIGRQLEDFYAQNNQAKSWLNLGSFCRRMYRKRRYRILC